MISSGVTRNSTEMPSLPMVAPERGQTERDLAQRLCLPTVVLSRITGSVTVLDEDGGHLDLEPVEHVSDGGREGAHHREHGHAAMFYLCLAVPGSACGGGRIRQVK